MLATTVKKPCKVLSLAAEKGEHQSSLPGYMSEGPMDVFLLLTRHTRNSVLST